VQFYAHQLAAVCIASAWILGEGVADRSRGVRVMALVGLLGGMAPLVDYQTAFAGVPVAAYLIWRMRAWPRRELARALAIAAAAAAVPLACLLYYHHACFGSAFATGYNYAVTYAADHEHGLLGMTYPTWVAIVGVTVSPAKGFFTLAPWWLLAIPGGVVLWRRGERALVVMVAALALIFFYFNTSLTAWHAGWEVGPRYIVALQPFLVPLVAAALAHVRDRPVALGVAIGLVAVGVVIYATSTATLPTWPETIQNPLYEVTFRLLGDNAVAPNALGALGVRGVLGALPFLAGIAALVAAIAYQAGARWRSLGLALVIACAGIAAFALASPGAAAAQQARAAYARTLYPAVAQ
jgi:hypothetical protein